MTYYSFIKEQDPEFQNETLGEDNAEKLRSGQLDSESFNKLSLDQLFPPMTLEEMVSKEKLSFKPDLKGDQ